MIQSWLSKSISILQSFANSGGKYVLVRDHSPICLSVAIVNGSSLNSDVFLMKVQPVNLKN